MEILRTFRMIPDVLHKAVLGKLEFMGHIFWKETLIYIQMFDQSIFLQSSFFRFSVLLILVFIPLLHVCCLEAPNQVWSPAALLLCTFLGTHSQQVYQKYALRLWVLPTYIFLGGLLKSHDVSFGITKLDSGQETNKS